MEGLAKFFKLKENNTDVKTEMQAGFTTFMTIAYIFVVNPVMLSQAGMDSNAVFVATIVSGAIATFMMAVLANYPFALASGMGLNAYFTFSIAMEFGWQSALLAVFIEGVLFMLLSVVNFREAIFKAIPTNLKHAVSIGLGCFIAFIGFSEAGVVVADSATKVTLGHLYSITTLLALIGVFVIVALTIKNVKGAILIGILTTYGLGVLCQAVGLYVVNPEVGAYSLYPVNQAGNFIVSMPTLNFDYNLISAFTSGHLSLSTIPLGQFFSILVALLFVDVFDTIGTLIGVSSKAGLLDENGDLPRIKPALMADAIGTTIGGVLGTSTVTTYVESAAGVAAGGKTGLTALTVSVLMILTLFFSPLVGAIPGFATAPALIVVGIFMFDSIKKVDLSSFEEVVPVFLTIILMPLTYSIADGLMFGFLSYCAVKVFAGKAKEVHPLIYGISAVFLIFEVVMPLLKM